MIEVDNLDKSYNKTFKAVDSITFKVGKGEIFGFLGPNGAGKTTTINMLTGILKPDQGQILINGFDIQKNGLEAKRQFGFVPDNPDVFLKLKGIEYLNFMADVFNVETLYRKKKIEELAGRFEMKNVLNDRIASYSHGMRQKIVIMGVLVHDPKVWILDEPMTGLDPKSSFTLKSLMREHCDKGNSVFFSTHVLEVAEKLCDRLAIINKGKIIFEGNLDEMKSKFKTNESLEEIFLEITNE